MNHLVRKTLNLIKYFFLILFLSYLLLALKIIFDERNEDISIEEKLADGFIGGLFAGFMYLMEFITYIFYPNDYRPEDWANIL